ncbi:MAG: amidohydrolase [Clostridia bacterium]|nr:amidohydrolase [Clostridia bacterium]
MKTIYINGKIYTGELPLKSAFIVENGSFTAVGSDEEMLALAESGDELIELSGRFVCSGFNDSHLHLLNYGQSLLSAKLYEHTESLSAVLECMRAQLEAFPPEGGAWLRGRGWNQDYFSDEPRMPNRFDLDSVSTEIPIMITRACGHCCVVNSRALEICGITAETVSPEGGAIGIEHGEPDGRLYDNAMELAFDKMPLPDKDGLKRMIRLACKALNSFGITSAQTDDYCVFRQIPFESINEAYRELEAEGELSVRVYEQCNFTELDELKRFVEAGNITGTGGELFKIGPLKLLGDGSLGSRTAHLSLPYLGTENETGFSLFSKEQFNALCSYANAHGMQIAVHAIGDACLDSVLDAIENALKEHPRSDHRHGIVHCQISRRDQLERMIRLKMHIYAQSIFLDYDNHIVEKLVPKALSDTSYNWKTLLDGGLTVSNGSDCPVELPDAMKGIECAVTRRSMDGTGPYLPEQAFSVKEALDSFTVFGARASFEECIKGRIAPGFLADFVILGSDPFETAPDSLHLIEVLKTFLGGREVFSKPRI